MTAQNLCFLCCKFSFVIKAKPSFFFIVLVFNRSSIKKIKLGKSRNNSNNSKQYFEITDLTIQLFNFKKVRSLFCPTFLVIS